jgi:glycosyltransferase involved in cell wall biosynthesis
MPVERPLISIVTPSFNQAAYIEDTIQSVLAQDYPAYEHIVIDGGSTDGTLDILRRYPHLRWISEKDGGQGDAVNKGFRLAQGEIIGWLNSDDTYLPGALSLAARELDRRRNRWIIMGQCEFIDDRTPTGIYHPRDFRGYGRLVQVWKGHSIPQPAVFFYKEVLGRCGNLDENLYFALDYDLFLRFARHYWFHPVDVPLATYRLHGESKTLAISEDDLLRRSVEVSRRYWGPRYSPSYWYFWSSYQAARSPIRLRANRFWNRAIQAHAQGHRLMTVLWLAMAVVLFPPLLWRRGQYPALELAKRLLGSERTRRLLGLHAPAKPIATVDGTVFKDGWVSDYAVVRCHAVGRAGRIAIEGEAYLSHFSGTPLRLQVSVNGLRAGEHTVQRSGHFLARFDVPGSIPGSGPFEVRIEPDKVFIPWELGVSEDRRRLSFVLRRVYASAE